MKFYRVRSEAYFRLSEIFVNDGNYSRGRCPYPVDWGNVGCREHGGAKDSQGIDLKPLWKS